MIPLNAPFYAFLSFIKNNGKIVRPLRVTLAHKSFVIKFRRKILFIVIIFHSLWKNWDSPWYINVFRRARQFYTYVHSNRVARPTEADNYLKCGTLIGSKNEFVWVRSNIKPLKVVFSLRSCLCFSFQSCDSEPEETVRQGLLQTSEDASIIFSMLTCFIAGIR